MTLAVRVIRLVCQEMSVGEWGVDDDWEGLESSFHNQKEDHGFYSRSVVSAKVLSKATGR